MIDLWLHFIKRLTPEGIRWPWSLVYNKLSHTAIFLRHYELVAHDVAGYGEAHSILDIGTGPGRLLLAIHEVLPDARLAGVDISPAMVALARRNLEAHGPQTYFQLRVADASALPFPDGAFDRVVSTGSLHHWRNQVGAFSEMHRVLKPGGYSLTYDLVRDVRSAAGEDARARFGKLRFAVLSLHAYAEPFLDVEEMKALGKQTGFMVQGTKFVGALCCLVLRKAAPAEVTPQVIPKQAGTVSP
jgi:ubiquinone/menaquinone biosynthesis C-methylase UbiE